MAIVLSHGGPTIFSSDAPSREVLVGTKEGIVRLERDGSSWRVAERMLTDRHISAILIEPESGAIFAGAYDNGSLQASEDGGRTWSARNKGLTETNVYSLASTRVAGGVRLFLGTEPAHLFCSDDLGHSWTELPGLRSVPSVAKWSFPAPPHHAHAKHISFDPLDPTTMYVGIEVGGLLRSMDGGQSWEELPGMDEDVHRLMINPKDRSRLYVTGGDGIYVSSDTGASWEHWATRQHPIGGYPDQLVLHPRRPELMFVASSEDGPGAWLTTHFAGSRASRSEDGGRTWRVLTNGLSDSMQAAVEAMSLEDWGDSFSVFFATTSGEVFASDDGGESWSLIADGLAPISKADHYRMLVRKSEPIKRKCEKCLAEWERARPATYENCPYNARAECPVNKAIALRSFS